MFSGSQADQSTGLTSMGLETHSWSWPEYAEHRLWHGKLHCGQALLMGSSLHSHFSSTLEDQQSDGLFLVGSCFSLRNPDITTGRDNKPLCLGVDCNLTLPQKETGWCEKPNLEKKFYIYIKCWRSYMYLYLEVTMTDFSLQKDKKLWKEFSWQTLKRILGYEEEIRTKGIQKIGRDKG